MAAKRAKRARAGIHGKDGKDLRSRRGPKGRAKPPQAEGLRARARSAAARQYELVRRAARELGFGVQDSEKNLDPYPAPASPPLSTQRPKALS